MAAQIRVDLCGSLTVTRDGRRLSGHEIGSRKERVLLALLATEQGAVVSADYAAEVLWGATQPADPGANLATLASRLRRLLGQEAVLGTRAGYRLSHAVVTDLGEAAALVAEAASADDRPGWAAAAATRSLAVLAAGDFVAENGGPTNWTEAVGRRIGELRRSARHVLARSSTAMGDHVTAVAVAALATEADPFDERAHRDLMAALAAAGRTAAALEVFHVLSARLRAELGVDADETTTAAYLALLRQERDRPAAMAVPVATPGRETLIGRENELRVIEEAWNDCATGVPGFVLVTGEAGIGKTRLLASAAKLAERTGGSVLSARCHAGESSLFLQPVLDLLRPALLHEPPAHLQRLLGPHAATWASLLPEVAATLDVEPVTPGAPDFERRRAYDAVEAVIRALQLKQPLLVRIDDLQEAGAATVDLLGFLVRRMSSDRVLLLAASRSEAGATIGRLSEHGRRVDLGPLPASAVRALASAAGLSAHADRVLARTAGHALSVVESLRALADGDAAVPATLAEAVMARVDRLETPARRGLEAAAALGVRVVPEHLAGLLEESEVAALERCRALVDARLLVVRGDCFEFSNDLVQETVLHSLPRPFAQAYHRLAANILVAQPEAMAGQAEAAGDPARAAQGWLLAGEDAMRRSAVEDAQALFHRSLEAARSADRSDLSARALLARARARDALTRYDDALADIDEALALSSTSGLVRLEMAAQLARGGDVAVALGRPLTECAAHLEAGLGLATVLGDRAAEAEFNARLTVLAAGRLQLSAGLHRANESLARARASGNEDALVPALDGLKTVYSFLADGMALEAVCDELVPLLRRRGDLFRWQWVVFESAFAPASRGDLAAARALVDEAIELNTKSGYAAYAAYFRAHRGWLARLAGDQAAALVDGRRALEESSLDHHPWWHASAAGLYASTLLAAGRHDEAAEVAALGSGGTEADRPEAYRLRCLAPYAAATGDQAALMAATRILAGIDAPRGHAWVVGADAYLDTAAAWLEAGDPDRSRQVLAPLAEATSPHRWHVVHERVTGFRTARSAAEPPGRRRHG